MNIPFEYWVILGLVGLYLYDSAKLLRFNQTIFSFDIFNRQYFDLASQNISIFHKYLCFMQPWRIGQVLVLQQWNFKSLPPSNIQAIVSKHKDQLHQLKYIQFITAFNTILTLLIFPILFLIQHNYVYLLICLGVIYSLNLIQIVYLLIHRSTFNISKVQGFHFLIDVLFCPPFALNHLKKISLNLSPQINALYYAYYWLTPTQYNHFLECISEDIDILKNMEIDSNSTSYQELEQLQQRLHQLKNYHQLQ